MSSSRYLVVMIVVLVLTIQLAMVRYLLSSSPSPSKVSIHQSATTRPPPLFCSNEVLGEKQRWNHNKKVISYSIFGPNQKDNNNGETRVLPEWVLHGIERNMLDAQLYYPDWVVRLYTLDLTQELQDKWLVHNATTFHNVELVHCFPNTSMTKSNSRKMMTRFLAYDDPRIWYTLVRDADSRFSLREVMAVNEFLGASMAEDNVLDSYDNNNDGHQGEQNRSQYKNSIYFHAMRDHKEHVVPVIGCMFGMKRGMLQASPTLNPNTTMTQLMDQALRDNPETLGGCCGEDQQFLSRHLWSHVKMLTLNHDIVPGRCRGFGAQQCRDFPLGPRNGSIDYFVGAPFKYQNVTTGQWHAIHKQHSCTLQCELTDETAQTQKMMPTENNETDVMPFLKFLEQRRSNF